MIIDYIFVKDPKKLKTIKTDSPIFKNTVDIEDIEEEVNLQIANEASKNKDDDMNVIKAYIGNLLYEKWFVENFTKNTNQIDRLPDHKIRKNDFYYIGQIMGTQQIFESVDFDENELSSEFTGIKAGRGVYDKSEREDDWAMRDMFLSVEEKALRSKKRHFAKGFVKQIENPIMTMENRMRLFPKGSASYISTRIKLNKRDAHFRQKEAFSNLKLQYEPSEVSDDQESTTGGYEVVNLTDLSKKRNEAINSEAFKNSIFHPEYKMKITREKESQKIMREIDKVYEEISKNFASKISEEWTELIYKISNQKKKVRKKKSSKSHSRSRSKKSSDSERKEKSEIDPIIKLKTIRENQKGMRKISNLDQDLSNISQNTKNSRRRGQIYRASERSSGKSNWKELQDLQQNKSRDGSIKESDKSDFSSSHAGLESSLKDTIDKKDKSIEQQDDESVKAAMTGFEDFTSNINTYFKSAYAEIRFNN
jgi:hypothetical protein